MSEYRADQNGSLSQNGRFRLQVSWQILVAVAVVWPWMAGCEDGLPTFQELIGQGEEESAQEPDASLPVERPTRRPVDDNEDEPEPPKRSPEEIVADFREKLKKPRLIGDNDLAELASVEEGLEEFDTLNVSRSGVTNKGLEHISKLPNLVELDISSVRFSNNGLKAIAGMETLEVLSLDNTPIYTDSGRTPTDPEKKYLDSGLAHIRDMPRLRKLRLAGAKITDEGLAHVASMDQLESLNLSNTGINNDQLTILETLVHLKELYLSGTRVTDEGFASFVPMAELEVLEMAKTRISGMGLLDLKKARGLAPLRRLKVDDTQFSDPGFKAIMGLQTLEFLDVGLTGANDKNLAGIRNLRNLRKIYLHENPRLSNDAMLYLKPLKELETIYLREVPGISNEGLANLKAHKKLRRLVLTETGCNARGARRLKEFLPDAEIWIGRTKY